MLKLNQTLDQRLSIDIPDRVLVVKTERVLHLEDGRLC